MQADLRKKFLWSLVLALLIYIALIAYADWNAMKAVLVDFPWLWIPAVLGLTFVNYAGRLLKWHWYLRLLKVPIRPADSARVFGVGMVMVMTPGKIGEFLKSYMVKRITGVPISTTAPAVLAERLTDGLAMLLLASVGLLAFDNPTARTVAAIAFLAIASIIVIVQVRPWATWCLRLTQRLPLLGRFAESILAFYESSYILLKPRNLLIAVGIGCISWICEGLAFYLILIGVGLSASLLHLLVAVFIFSISTVIGAVIATPGGVGGTEGSLITLSIQLLGLARTPAASAALLVRFATLWFGVALGMLFLALWPELIGLGNMQDESFATAETTARRAGTETLSPYQTGAKGVE